MEDNTRKIKIMLADDHHVVLDGLTALIKATDDLEVVEVAYNGHHALKILETHQIDVAVLDIEMPVIDGLKATKEIKAKYPDIKVLILTMYNNERFIKEIIKSGASGYILKNKGGNELTEAIRAVHRGEEYFTQSVTDTLIEGLRKKKKGSFTPKLTTREKEVLFLIVEGNSSREISEKLFIAGTTVETHRRNLIEKLGVKGTKGLIRHAIEHNLLNE